MQNTPEFSIISPTYRCPQIRVLTVQDSAIMSPHIERPENAAAWFRETVTRSEWYDPDKECFVVAHLNRKTCVKNWTMVTLGTATATLAHPREVFRAAIASCATAIFCFHNHPSGDPAPSRADMAVTRQLRDAAKIIDIALLDHVIIGEPACDPTGLGHFSFRLAGLL